VLSLKEFSAPPLTPGALSVSQVQAGDEGSTPAVPGFLGKAVGSVHESLKYWKDTFEEDSYLMWILENGYKIPVHMSDTERRTRYREKTTRAPATRCHIYVRRLLGYWQTARLSR
jgi:hypothetical protein